MFHDEVMPRRHAPRPCLQHPMRIPLQAEADSALIEANHALMQRLREFVSMNDANVEQAEAGLRRFGDALRSERQARVEASEENTRLAENKALRAQLRARMATTRMEEEVARRVEAEMLLRVGAAERQALARVHAEEAEAMRIEQEAADAARAQEEKAAQAKMMQEREEAERIHREQVGRYVGWLAGGIGAGGQKFSLVTNGTTLCRRLAFRWKQLAVSRNNRRHSVSRFLKRV